MAEPRLIYADHRSLGKRAELHTRQPLGLNPQSFRNRLVQHFYRSRNAFDRLAPPK